MAKGLKLIVKSFWGLIPTFVEVTGEKLVGLFGHPPWIRLKSDSHVAEGFGQTKVF